MLVLVQRERVAMVDEGHTPPTRRFEVPDTATLGELLARIRKADFLPSIPGGRATWIVEGDRPLAVVTQEYREAWPLVGLGVPFAGVGGRLPRPHLGFRYLAQRSPEDVFRELGGDPVRLSREAFEASAEIPWAEAMRRFFSDRGKSRRSGWG